MSSVLMLKEETVRCVEMSGLSMKIDLTAR